MGTTQAAGNRTLERPQHWLASAFALHLVHLVERWHVSSARLLEGLGISESELAEPGAMLPLDTVIALWDQARTLTGEPGLGFHLGLSERAIGWGYLGFAAMSAETYAQALEVIRYTPVLSTMFSLRLEVNGGVASLIAEEHSDPKTARDMLLIELLVGLRHVGEDITGGHLEASIDFAIPEPEYYRRFAALVPRVRFGEPVSRLFFPDSSLALPLVMADPIAKRLARDQCERALQDIGADEVFVASIRRALFGSDGFRSQREVALKLGVTPRNLMRMLAQRGMSFAGLADDEREKRARRMLLIPGGTMEEVAAHLGYSTASNFVRAFHRWTGQTPAAYRRSMRSVGTK